MFEEGTFVAVYSILLWAVSTTLTVFVSYILWKNGRTQKLLDKIPGFKAWPLVGDCLHLSSNKAESFQQLLAMIEQNRHNKIFKLKMMETAWIFLFSAQEVEQILGSKLHISKSNEYKTLHRWLGSGLLTSSGSKWKSQRRLLAPSFHFSILKDYLVLINKHAINLRDKLQLQACDSGEIYDIVDDITLATLEIICDSAMGIELSSLGGSDSEYVKSVALIKKGIHIRKTTAYLRPDFFFNISTLGRRINKAIDYTHQFTLKVIRERREATLSGEDLTEEKRAKPFLDMLIDCRDEKGEALTDLDIREEVDTFMFAGHDTTSSAIMYTIYMLGIYPESQRRCQEEIDEVLATSKDVAHADLSKLTYLEWCIKESMRLLPPVPYFSRKLSEEINIGGYLVPSGVTVVISTASLHRDPAVFPEPEKFDPTRFSSDKCARRHPYAYIPFSAGSRNCVGQKFAMMEIKVVVATLLKSFNIECKQTIEELRVNPSIVLQPDNGVKVKVTSRY